MENQAQVLKNNSHYLKACILYEVLKKKPVFDSYRSFCKTIGDDVMDYVNFEYWFYRFYNGNCDFDHDRSQEPKQKALLELPAEILSMITEEIEPMERVFFSTVSKTIKGICDITPKNLKYVNVSLSEDLFNLSFDNMKFQYSGGIGVPSKLKINDGPEREIRSNFLMFGLKTTRRIFAMPHLQIEHLTLCMGRNIQLSFPGNLHVKSVKFDDCEPNIVFGILNRLQSGTLERIQLISFSQPTNLALLLESKHFLEAKEVDIRGFGEVTTMEELRKFSHLARFQVFFDNITPEIVVGIRDMLSTSKVFKSCVIEGVVHKATEACRALGAYAAIEPNGNITHRTRIEGSRDFLKFSISEYRISVEKVH